MAGRRVNTQPRVATACSACRARRTKCIIDPGEKSCKYCRNKGQECIVHAPDERKRPNSKGYLSSLLDSIGSLEQRLREVGNAPPNPHLDAMRSSQKKQLKQTAQSQSQSQSRLSPENSQRRTAHMDPRRASHAPLWQLNTGHDRPNASPGSKRTSVSLGQPPKDDLQRQSNDQDLPRGHDMNRQRSGSEPQLDRTKKSTVWTLIYGPDRLLYDKERGRIHYFSPSTCFKNYVRDNLTLETWNLDKWTYRVLTDIPVDLDTYLMDQFWHRYNNTLGIVDRQAFCRDQASGASTYYSGFLHLVCLAMGFQFADKDRPGMQQATLNDGSNLFQREIKYILERELENPRGLTTIQAMLVLSDVECASGRDDLAAMHIGTSCRLALDFGLTINCSELGLSEEELKFRRKLLRSCMIYDRAWALYLGRPASMKLCDISTSCLTMRVAEDSIATTSPRGSLADEPLSSDHDTHGQISDALLDLAELCLKIQEIAQPRLVAGKIGDEDRLLEVAVIDKRLKSWYSMLPSHVKWTLENARSAPPLFFMMHQQFHIARILLFGPYGHYEDVVGIEVAKAHVFGKRNNDHSNISPWQRLARSVTMEAAIKLTQCFSAYRQRFGSSQASVLSLQQGGTTCLTLMCIIKASRTPETRNLGLQHMYLLMEQLQEMSDVYSSAKVICSVVKHEMEQLRINFTELLTPPQTPDAFDFRALSPRARRESSESPSKSESGPAPKRRRLINDCQGSEVANAAMQPCEPGQGMPPPERHNSARPQGTGGELPIFPPSQNIPLSLSQGTIFSEPNFELMQHVADPLFHLPAVNTSSPMDFSALSASFGDPTLDQINDFLPAWLPEGHFFDVVDDGSGTMPDLL